MTLIIDNTLITNNVMINVVNDKNEKLSSFLYHIGTKVEIDETYFNNRIYLEFDYIGMLNDEYKYYHYKIELQKGNIANSNYIIFRIFNLDKDEYSKAFCKKPQEYVVEIQNQIYSRTEVQCKEFKKF